MILEGIVTTVSESGEINIAPMGPSVTMPMKQLLLRPFQTSQTYRNLSATGVGVFHVTDDVLLLAQAAVGTVDPAPRLLAASQVAGWILADACRYYEFRVERCDDSEARTRIPAEIVGEGRLRDFFGFNRAKHAVVEAAILATRLRLQSIEQVRSELDRLAVLVDKTGGPREHDAFRYLMEYVTSRALEGSAGTEST